MMATGRPKVLQKNYIACACKKFIKLFLLNINIFHEYAAIIR